MSTQILIADDHGVLRAGLSALLNAEPDMEVVGEADCGSEALQKAVQLRPDVVLMDLSMPDIGGIEATRRIKELLPEVQILVLTVHEDKQLLQESIRAGASGYILKRAVKTELINAIHAALQGDLYLHPAMARLLLTEAQIEPKSFQEPVEQLTSREIEVLKLIAKGYTNKQAAEILCVSVRTVEFHRRNLMNKLNMNSRAELVRYASEHNLT